MFRTLILSLSLIISFSAFAEGHHEREKVKIEIAEHHHHHKQKGIGRMFFDGSVQLIENNAYLLSAASAGLFAVSCHSRRTKLEITAAVTAGIWIGGGMITRSVMKAIMSQADIKRI